MSKSKPRPVIHNGMTVVLRHPKVKVRKNHRGSCLKSLNDGRCLYCKAPVK